MREFFKPWQRKAGVMMLLIALMFTAGWIRGGVIADFIRIATGKDGSFNLLSRRGCIVLSFEQFPRNSGPTTSSYIAMRPHDAEQWYSLEEANPKVHVQGCGFRWSKYDEGVPSSPVGEPFIIRTTALRVPYWSLALPAALLSAWLLFSKPSALKPPAEQPQSTCSTVEIGTVEIAIETKRPRR